MVSADGMNVGRFGDIEVAYRTVGEGDDTVVMIHGLGQDHRIWANLQAGLADRRNVAYDVRGHGASTLGDGAGTLAQLGLDLMSLLESVGPAVLVGFSLGGSIALWTAAERPDLVRAVVAVATSSVVGRAAAAGLDERIAIFEKGDPEAIRAQILTDTKAQLASASIDAEAVTADRVAAVRDPGGYVNAARAVRGMRDEPLNDRLAEIAAPVLVVSGERDVWCPRRAAEIMLEHLPPGASFEELADVGHLITEDAPDALTGVVKSWLNGKEI
jgi:pimeloyl-ACP methyl ester carboxylesterase